MNSPETILKTYWGYDAFRPLQRDIIDSVLAGADTLALLPTGGGKSICFQVPALAKEGICIVVTPLIALMKDQVEQLKKRNIKAAAVYSGMSFREIDILLDNCIHGGFKFLYVSPERLKTELFLERAKKMNISLLAVDEAHCISQWGYDFRPPYLEIAEFRRLIPDVNVIALTATATGKVRDDILDKLEMTGGRLFVKSFARSNLAYVVRWEEDKEQKALEIFRAVQGTAIVYVRSRKRARDFAALLKRNRISADFYHAGLSNAARAKKQERWINNTVRVMVATNAFGMGIDKPDVRLVIHMDLPESLEAYFQEAGRAGRDGKKAYAAAIVNDRDIQELRERVAKAYPSIDFLKKVYQSLANFFKIAVGSSMLAGYDFDLQEFAAAYDLNVFEAYNAIKKLESEGLVQLNESFHNPSELYFTSDKKALYEYQIAHAEMENVIKVTLRLYGGELFSGFTRISESQIASLANVTVEETRSKLDFLHEAGLAIYDKQKEKPQIVFLTPRYDAAKLPIDQKRYKNRKDTETDKVEAVIHYVQNGFQCRSLQLLAYFDELSYEKCGVCDVCQKEKHPSLPSDKDFFEIRERLFTLCANEISIGDVLQQFSFVKREQALYVAKRMLDQNELEILDNGRLRRVNK